MVFVRPATLGSVLWATLLVALLTGTACADPPEAELEVFGVALAGPVCPVETNPPDPACAPRPVVGAKVLAVSDSGEEFESTTDGDGRFSLLLPPDKYEVIAQPVQGLMGSPTPVEIEVRSEAIDLGVLEYDTGIR